MSKDSVALVKQETSALATASMWEASAVVQQTRMVAECMRAVMKKDEHFGIIPGTPKPSLWQPGADKLCLMFRLRPRFTVETATERPDYIGYVVRCELLHIPTGHVWGEGMGACNSREKKYTQQTDKKACPKCKALTIFKSKQDDGWFCWVKKGGCGAQFKANDKSITEQVGQADTNAVHDLQNTILKMAQKRAKVAAVLTATAASDLFTQDLEDLPEFHDAVTVEARPVRREAEVPHNPETGEVIDAEEVEVSAEPFEDSVECWHWDKHAQEWVSRGHEPKANHKQVALIHLSYQKLEIPEAKRRERLQQLYNKDSTALLSISEASDCIDRLNKALETGKGPEGKVKREKEKLTRVQADMNESLHSMGMGDLAREPDQDG